MEGSVDNFQITAGGTTYLVERCTNRHKLYRLYSKQGNYLIAKDYYNIWVELDRKFDSPDISLSKIGEQIDAYQNGKDTLYQFSAKSFSL